MNQVSSMVWQVGMGQRQHSLAMRYGNDECVKGKGRAWLDVVIDGHVQSTRFNEG